MIPQDAASDQTRARAARAPGCVLSSGPLHQNSGASPPVSRSPPQIDPSVRSQFQARHFLGRSPPRLTPHGLRSECLRWSSPPSDLPDQSAASSSPTTNRFVDSSFGWRLGGSPRGPERENSESHQLRLSLPEAKPIFHALPARIRRPHHGMHVVAVAVRYPRRVLAVRYPKLGRGPAMAKARCPLSLYPQPPRGWGRQPQPPSPHFQCQPASPKGQIHFRPASP